MARGDAVLGVGAMTVHWPFPGDDTPPPPPDDLPPPRFAVGDRVISRWGDATVLAVLDWAGCDDSRMYHIRHDWSGAPEGFGHHKTEDELQPGRPRVELDDDDESPPMYQVGDRVSLRNGATGTVSHVYSKLPDRPRQYRVAFDGASAVGYP
jgi:hypothetical protein